MYRQSVNISDLFENVSDDCNYYCNDCNYLFFLKVNAPLTLFCKISSQQKCLQPSAGGCTPALKWWYRGSISVYFKAVNNYVDLYSFIALTVKIWHHLTTFPPITGWIHSRLFSCHWLSLLNKILFAIKGTAELVQLKAFVKGWWRLCLVKIKRSFACLSSSFT